MSLRAERTSDVYLQSKKLSKGEFYVNELLFSNTAINYRDRNSNTRIVTINDNFILIMELIGVQEDLSFSLRAFHDVFVICVSNYLLVIHPRSLLRIM